jgi:hypothetical protein
MRSGDERRNSEYQNDMMLARGLGWLSIGLGCAGLGKPREVAKSAGLDADETAVRTIFGARETLCGIGLLTQDQPTGWLWARVAGDVIDLSMLGTALASDGTKRERTAAATAAVAAITALDVYSARRLSAKQHHSNDRDR